VVPGDTISDVLERREQRGDNVWMRQKELGIWRSWTWNQTAEAVREIAGGLAPGLQARRDGVSILSNTVVEWVLADLAVLCAAACPTASTPPTRRQVHYLCEDSRTTCCSSRTTSSSTRRWRCASSCRCCARSSCSTWKACASWTTPVISLDALRELGREFNAAHPGRVSAARQACKPEDLAILVYTSGTTGKPKGAMHTHGGLVYTVRGYNTLIAQDEATSACASCRCATSPSAWAASTSSIYTGSKLNFVENPETVPENVREIAPTVFTAVPRVWEKFYSGGDDRAQGSQPLQQLPMPGPSAWASIRRPGAGGPAGAAVAEAAVHAGALAGAEQRAQADRHSPRALPGDRRGAHLARSGQVVPGAGRAHAGSLGHDRDLRRGHRRAGCAHQARLDRPGRGVQRGAHRPATGEILVRGPNVFMGYLNLPEKTAETIDADGWLHTGDVGLVDEDGYFRITDRMKDIIITAGGKNITPSELENELKFSPYITDAVVIGDKRPT
jgi:long-chain acyl-CoA synthetase